MAEHMYMHVSKRANMAYKFYVTMRCLKGEKFLISVRTHNQNRREVKGFCDVLLPLDW